MENEIIEREMSKAIDDLEEMDVQRVHAKSIMEMLFIATSELDGISEYLSLNNRLRAMIDSVETYLQRLETLTEKVFNACHAVRHGKRRAE